MLKKILVLLLVSMSAKAQSSDLFDKTKKWILVDNKIERNEIILQAYDSLLIDYNTLILQFMPNKTIEYDYESTAEACAGVDFLDIDTENTSWAYDSKNFVFTLTFKGGYSTLDGFQFKRDYRIERYEDASFILIKTKEYYFTDLEKIARKAEKAEKKKESSKIKIK